MSPTPDPPREEETHLRRLSGEFMEQEFLIDPDAPYELDVDEESDYSDSDAENELGAVGGTTENSGGSGDATQGSEEIAVQGQIRTRYRLLIPFTVDSGSSTTTNASTEEISETTNATIPENTSSSSHDDSEPTTSEATVSTSTTLGDPSSHENSERTIEMTEEKVETIMQVMKNITLPANAIPKWASEVDEDVWRKKLHESLENKSNTKNSSEKRDGVKDKDVKSSASSSE